MKAFEPGDENTYICHKEPDPDDINREGEVKVYRLNPDGTRGEMLRTMDAFPVGWNDPAQFRKTPGRGPAKKEGEGNMVETNWKEITQKVQTLVDEGLSTYKASRAVSKEIGVHYTTIYNRVRKEIQVPDPVPAAAANQEPEREEAESAGTSLTQEKPEFTVKDVNQKLQYELAQREQGYGPEDEEPIPYVPVSLEKMVIELREDLDLERKKVAALEKKMELLASALPAGSRTSQENRLAKLLVAVFRELGDAGTA